MNPRQPNNQQNKNTSSEWQQLSSSNGHFWAMLPGSSTYGSYPVSTAVGDINMHVVDQQSVAWFATYSDFPKEHTDSNAPINLLESSYDGVVKMITMKTVLKKEFYKINVFDALKADVTGNMSGIHVRYRGILAFVDNKLYQIYSLAIGETFDLE